MNCAIRILLVAVALLSTSCGGGLVAGIEGSGTRVASVGPVTGFGSIFVNGVEYTTTNAQIEIDGQPGTESELSVGDIVRVSGTVNAAAKTGSATQVTFGGNVVGNVQQVNVPTRSLVVLGQTVLVTGSTVFGANIQPADIAGIQPGARVEVSGFANSFGQIVASRVQVAAAGTPLRVQGVVQALNTNALTFQVNALLVNYSAATSSGMLANGDIVTVQGNGLSATGALTATAVEVLPAPGGEANSEGDVEGVITAFTSSTDFMIAGLHVTTNANTQFSLNSVTLGVNIRVEVEGAFDTSGTLVATSVVAQPDSESLVRGLVQALPSANTLTVLGVAIVTNAGTELEDNASQMLRPFRLSDVRVGDYIDARGTAGTGAVLNAEVLVRQPPDTLSFLQSTATNVSAPNLTLLGSTVTTTAQTQFTGPDGTALTATQFFAQAPNATVEVGGTSSSGSFLATEAHIEGQ